MQRTQCPVEISVKEMRAEKKGGRGYIEEGKT